MPSYENTFRRLDLNQWVSTETKWISTHIWEACAKPVSEQELLGAVCCGGLDISQGQADLTCLSLVFPQGEDSYALIPYFFAPEDLARERERRDKVPYTAWARQGFIQLTPGRVTNEAFILQRVEELSQKFRIREIGFDKYNSWFLTPRLSELGLTPVEVSQRMAGMCQPTKEFEKLLVSCKIRVGTNPILAWNAANVVIEREDDNIKPSKKYVSSTKRIDGISASIMGLSRAMVIKYAKQPAQNVPKCILI